MASIVMPQLGESVTEGTVTRWLKQEGDRVSRDEPLLEVMTDKVNAEIPSPFAGLLTEIVVPEGTKVAVGELLATIVEAGQDKTAAVGEETYAQAGQPAKVARGDQQTPDEEAAIAGGHFSPLVRRLAREHGIDLTQIRGSGIGGRVTKDDVLNYVTESRMAGQAQAFRPAVPATVPAPVAPPSSQPSAPALTPNGVPTQGEQIVTPSPMRLAIAEHMVRSKQTAPHAWTMVEVDMTPLVRWREQIKAEFERREGVALTYLPFVVKAVVTTLKEIPLLNASWVDGKIVLKQSINIGIAVAIDEGLIVPVVRNADQISVAGLAKAINDLASRARAGKLSPNDVQQGTFTVNNPGAFGSVVSMPIINQGQAGILAMEAIVKRLVVLQDDAIAVRSMMNLALSFDHRITDGALAGRFLQAVKRRLEESGPNTPLY